jgi:hypothetical protein
MSDSSDARPVRCTGKVKSTGEQCRLNAIPGGTVCSRWHGGAAPQVRAAAERRMTRAAVEAAVVTYGLPIETTAEDALFDELYRSKGHVAWLQERLQEMAPEDLIWGVSSETVTDVRASEFKGVDTRKVQSAAVHVWLDLYQRERKHYLDVAATIAKLNLEERRVRIDETKATVLTAVLRAVLRENGLSLQDEQVAGQVRRHLQLVTSEQQLRQRDAS